ncbi:Ig-like domain-containing protein [uncultured Porphyromonas sp.]|jgi:hypothetical protein|uniref:Ig-like domain-containing protein n=1 Tax=uncultured Porphyromonas sp. TaxID=159274 RepID=UPI002804560B|nr:Ig-like domain-containing protein [uncultured Porphyromonas sp.]
MRKLSVILSTLLLLVGLGACKKDTPKVDPNVVTKATNLTLAPKAVSLKVGDTQQLTATVEPTDKTFIITFTSEKPEVATVDATGLVKAVTAGTTSITANVGKLMAKCVVTVTENSGSGGTTIKNELPLLMFEATTDDKGVINQEVLDHEAQVGRKAQPFRVWGQGPFVGGFVNRDLTIVGVMYGLVLTDFKEYVIPAFSKETLANCPKTLSMLAEYGFTTFKDDLYDESTPFKKSLNDNDPSVSVEIYDNPDEALGSTLMLLFTKPMPKKDIETAHAIIPDARDFPNYVALMSKDMAKIKEFETNLGLREYDAKGSNEAKKNLFFTSKASSIAQTNFSLVYYGCTPIEGSPFINSVVNFIKNATDFDDPKLKEWFTANGYGKEFKTNSSRGYAMGYDPTGKILAQLFMNSEGTIAMLQIVEKPQTQSAAQMRSLAMKQYKEMQSHTKTKHLKLQQLHSH